MYYPSSENKGAEPLTAKLICAFVFTYAVCWFSYEAAHFKKTGLYVFFQHTIYLSAHKAEFEVVLKVDFRICLNYFNLVGILSW